MISKKDKIMFRDAHDKLTLWLRKWDKFVKLNMHYGSELFKKTFKKYKKYFAYCSLCERFQKDAFICPGCPLEIKGLTCHDDNSPFDRAYFHKDKSALIEMIRIVDEAWKKARG